MMTRCYNPGCASYERYGGRGITVCKRWHDPRGLLTDMGDLPFAGAELDRIDVNGDYEPDNCRWVTKIVNANNKTNNRFYEYAGQMMTLAQISKLCGVPYYTLSARLIRGWDMKKATTNKKFKRQPVTRSALKASHD